jgi:uncharacterized protein (DUF952 family)
VRWLYHVCLQTDDHGDPYRPASLEREGFVHCSFQPAAAESARLYFPPDAALVVLQIDPRLLPARVEVADTPRGKMPHIHGPVPRAAVVARLTLDELAKAPDRIQGRMKAK